MNRKRGGRLNSAVGVLGEILVTMGVVVMLFVAWQVWWVTHEATGASAAVVNDLTRQFQQAGPAPAAPGASGAQGPAGEAPIKGGAGTALKTGDFATDTAFGLVTVPRFGNGPQPILQGTSITQLDQGVGHDPKTVMPGQVGNFSTAGHRDTYSHPYNHIDALREGDAIVVEVKDGWAIYRVAYHHIVLPTQTEVYAPVPNKPGQTPTEAWMTMLACEPHWTAQKRWVVHSKLEAWIPRTARHKDAASTPQVQQALAAPADGVAG